MQATHPRPDMIAVWQAVPDERTKAFLTVFGAVARTMQQALRRRVPAMYFSDAGRYKDLSSALPMLVYQYSRPVSRRQKRELAYDVLSTRMMSSFYWSAEQDLPNGLAEIEAYMRQTGHESLATVYTPRRVRRIIGFARHRRELLHRLLASEEKLLRDLANFAAGLPLCRRPSTLHAQLLKRWRYTLSRFYPGIDASGFAEELLEIATSVLPGGRQLLCEVSGRETTTSA